MLLRPRTNFDGILLVHWIADTSGTLEIRSLLANIFDEKAAKWWRGRRNEATQVYDKEN